jgi:hypothetical protein
MKNENDGCQLICSINLSIKKEKGKFAIGHCYFLAFAETHCSIVSLPGTITIL